ncbi:MAG: hypothetical protein QXU92_02615 [Candidatus Diapherotrites archaeon]
MVLSQKQFAKTFDEKQDEFVVLKSNVDLDTLEAMRFIQSQINLFESKLLKLTRFLEHGGQSKAALEEGIKRVESLEKRLRIIDAKISLYSSMLEEIDAKFSELENSIVSLANLSDTKDLMERIARIEKIESETRTYNFKYIFLNCVELIGSVGKRINGLEKSLGITPSNLSPDSKIGFAGENV